MKGFATTDHLYARSKAAGAVAHLSMLRHENGDGVPADKREEEVQKFVDNLNRLPLSPGDFEAMDFDDIVEEMRTEMAEGGNLDLTLDDDDGWRGEAPRAAVI